MSEKDPLQRAALPSEVRDALDAQNSDLETNVDSTQNSQTPESTNKPASIIDLLNADDSNQAAKSAYEQSGMTYMEWLDNGGYKGYLHRERANMVEGDETDGQVQKQQQSYRDARAVTLNNLENNPDRVAEQVVTKNGDSWSYIRDEQDRKHRVGSQYASDLAQEYYQELTDEEKQEISGVNLSISKKGSLELDEDGGDNTRKTSEATKFSKQTKSKKAKTQKTSNQTQESAVGKRSQSEKSTENDPGFWEEFRLLAASRLLPKNMLKYLRERWDNSEEQRNDTSRRKNVAFALAGLAFTGFMFGGITSSAEQAPEEPTTSSTDVDLDIPELFKDSPDSSEPEQNIPELDLEAFQPEYSTISITIPEGGNVWNEVEKLINNGEGLPDNSEKQAIVDQIVDALEAQHGDLDVVHAGDTYEIGDILNTLDIDPKNLDLAA